MGHRRATYRILVERPEENNHGDHLDLETEIILK
jgi:hypothetical protein